MSYLTIGRIALWSARARLDATQRDDAFDPDSFAKAGWGRMVGEEDASMATPVELRSDFDHQDLRFLARRTSDRRTRQRLEAIAAVYDGASRAEAAALAGVGTQVLRDWIIRFNVEGPDGCRDRPSANKPAMKVHIGWIMESLRRDSSLKLEDVTETLYQKHGISVSTRTLMRRMARKAEV